MFRNRGAADCAGFGGVKKTGRIGMVTVSGNHKDTATVVFVTVYAQQSGLDDTEWEKTVEELEELLASPDLVKPGVIVVVGGDFNCHLGRRSKGVTHRQCVHKTPNARGEKLLDLMASVDYVAASTFFKQKGRGGSATHI